VDLKNTDDALKSEIYQLIKKYSAHSDIEFTEETSVGDLGIDSIDLMEIIFHIEEVHGVEIDENSLEKLSVLGDIMHLAKVSVEARY
jgi:acyl carrier protein